jgi:hypothetical protein
VKSEDPRCPFCGALSESPVASRRRGRRTSRAQWLALGSIALAGCAGSIAETPPGDGGSSSEHDAAGGVHDSGVARVPEEAGTLAETGGPQDASAAAQDAGGSAFACNTRSGYFQCQANVCDRSIQACYQGQCVWYGELASYGAPDSAACDPCPTCECLGSTLYPGCHCTDDGAGAITISCQGCYGSPPARLERMA